MCEEKRAGGSVKEKKTTDSAHRHFVSFFFFYTFWKSNIKIWARASEICELKKENSAEFRLDM